jgi:hypothetical protein
MCPPAKHGHCIYHQARIPVFSISAHKYLYKITYRVQLFLKAMVLGYYRNLPFMEP